LAANLIWGEVDVSFALQALQNVMHLPDGSGVAGRQCPAACDEKCEAYCYEFAQSIELYRGIGENKVKRTDGVRDADRARAVVGYIELDII
jgi:hypothetical protein